MRVLLDTHAVLWAADSPAKLGAVAASTISDPRTVLLVSAATVWEISIKFALGKLSLSGPYLPWMHRVLAGLNAAVLPITPEYAAVQATLPLHHRDPFDRLLVAQALAENVPLVSADAALDAYGVTRLW